ncbi:MAG: 50S ribosomal protein L11 methyltransferase [Candidatus Melainabacteria bacterium]|nr:50S ribosomal protein L11 methyltransferase [Candidatus Melainabacteria bacterium]
MSPQQDTADIKLRLNRPDTRLRINAETYVKFDGGNHVVIQNAYSEAAVRIKYDILLVLYELVEWNSIETLLAPWPTDDRHKIVDYLEMFYQAQIILLEGETPTENPLPPDGNAAPESVEANTKTRVHINVENHHTMLKDHVRMTAYRRAIERAVSSESVVMDLGSGTGVLSFFAAKAGAAKVYAVERQPHIVELSKLLAEANGLVENISFIEGVSNLVQPHQLEPRPNLLVAEIIGTSILEENILEYTLDARDRLLAPGGQMIPYRLDLFTFGFYGDSHDDKPHEVEAFQDLYGLDFSILKEVLCSKAILHMGRYTPAIYTTMTEPVCVQSLDFRTLQSANFTRNFQLLPNRDGCISGFCTYFKVHLDEDTLLTNSPWAPVTHWLQMLYTLPQPILVKAQEPVAMEMIYDGALKVRPLWNDPEAERQPPPSSQTE